MGEDELQTITEETVPKPISSNAKKIYKEEKLVQEICKKEQIPFIIIRTSPLYGPWQPNTMAFQAAFEKLQIQDTDFRNGDMLFVEDAVQSIIQASMKQTLYGEIIHLSSADNEAWEKGMSLINEEVTIDKKSNKKIHFCNKKAKSTLEFDPNVSIEEGIKRQREFVQYKKKLDKMGILDME